MKARKFALITAIVLVGVVALTGCAKKAPPPPARKNERVPAKRGN